LFDTKTEKPGGIGDGSLMKCSLLFVISITFSIFTAGCASFQEAAQISKSGTNKAITGPDGSPHELIQCFSIEVCYKKATEVCHGKYRIINDSTSYHDKDVSSLTSLLVKCQ
jgi:hypothetical protein